MAKGMTLAEAKGECERWFASLKRQEEKAIAMQKIAAARRAGEIDEQEGRRRVRALDGAPTVFDGANLEKAVRLLLKQPGREWQSATTIPPHTGGTYLVGTYDESGPLPRHFVQFWATFYNLSSGFEWDIHDPKHKHRTVEYWIDIPPHPEYKRD